MKNNMELNIKYKMITGLESYINTLFSEYDRNNDLKIIKNINYFKDSLNVFRLDIKNEGNEANNINISYKKNKYFVSTPEWFTNQKGKGYKIESNNKEIRLKFKCINKGDLKIEFRTRDFRNFNHKRIPIYSNLYYCSVNNQIIKKEDQLIYHDFPYRYSKKSEDGDIIEIKSNIKNIYDFYPHLENYLEIDNEEKLDEFYRTLMTYLKIEKLLLSYEIDVN